MKRENSNISKKLNASIAAVILLAIGLCITTFALIWATVSVNNNLFHTGTIKINLNDGKPIIQEQEFLFEPGMTIRKEFFIENQSTWDVYYKLYLEEVEGSLADVLDIKICHGDIVLYEGKASELSRKDVKAAEDVLRLNERRVLTAYLHFPENEGNSTQSQYLTFTMKADAVQTKNNREKQFD